MPTILKQTRFLFQKPAPKLFMSKADLAHIPPLSLKIQVYKHFVSMNNMARKVRTVEACYKGRDGTIEIATYNRLYLFIRLWPLRCTDTCMYTL